MNEWVFLITLFLCALAFGAKGYNLGYEKGRQDTIIRWEEYNRQNNE